MKYINIDINNLKVVHIISKYFIIQILIAILVGVTFILNVNSFKTFSFINNFSDETSCQISLSKNVGNKEGYDNSKLMYSFDAQSTNLNGLMLTINEQASHLNSSDILNVFLENENGEILVSTNVFVYNVDDNTINVTLNNIPLVEGESYYIELDASEFSDDSNLILKSHVVDGIDVTKVNDNDNFFGKTRKSIDHAIGFNKVPNVTYKYGYFSPLYLIINGLFYMLTVVFFFIPKLYKSPMMIEIYRGGIVSTYLYLIGQVLNVKNATALNLFYPTTIKHYFCMIIMIILIFLLYMFFYMATGYGNISMLLVSIPFLIFAFVNSVKLVMRGDTVMPWDLSSAGIAIKTGSKFYFHITKQFISGILLTIAFILMIVLLYTPRLKFSKLRLTYLFTSALVMVSIFFSVIINRSFLDRFNIYYQVYPPIQSSNEDGTYLAFLLQLNNLNSKVASDYSQENFKRLLDKYSAKQYIQQDKLQKNISNNLITTNQNVLYNNQYVKPNVICIMSEAYSNLFKIRKFSTTEEVTPFRNSIIDDTINGELAVSIFGGGTCNTEFEFLTGYSMSSLLPGTSAYTYYIKHKTEALPQIYKNYGYRTVALHSFDGEWWDRNTKYPLLGFDEFYTQDNFDVNTQRCRRYISDMSTFHKITDIVDNNNSIQNPLFLFCVTMQNHADFAEHYPNMKYDIKINDFLNEDGSHFKYAENYVSLLRESDDALEYLINHLKETQYPTIVCFFGDHLPTLNDGFYDKILDKNMDNITLNESLPLYNTEYFIWSNYELDKNDNAVTITSPNFLGQNLLKLSGINIPSSRAVLPSLNEKISAISAVAVYDKDGVPHTNINELSSETIDMINDYNIIQYGLIYKEDDSE